MRFDTRQPWIRSVVALLLVGLLAAAATGCEKSPKDKLRAAKVAVLNEKPDQAQEHLDAVLKAEPDSFEANRLMGRVQQLRGNFAKAEETLAGLWDKQGFGDEAKKLSTEQESQKQRLEEDLTDLYQKWATSLQESDNPEKFEEVVKKGLEIDEKKPRLNGMLVDFHQNRAKKLVEEGKKLEAADHYEKILELVTSRDIRDKAEERAGNLRFEVNKEQMLTYFNEKAKAKFVEQKLYDKENNAIMIAHQKSRDAEMESQVEAAIKESKGEEVDLKRNNNQHAAIICDIAMRQELVPALKGVIVEATGIPADSDFSTMKVPASVTKGVKIGADRRNCGLEAKLPLDDVLKMGFEIKEQTRKAKAEEAEKGDKVAEAEADAKPKAEAEQAADKK